MGPGEEAFRLTRPKREEVILQSRTHYLTLSSAVLRSLLDQLVGQPEPLNEEL